MNICIIIPAHNEEAFIERCLESLVSQTYQAAQIIVVNDNSTDQTPILIDEFAKKYSYIQAVHTTSSEAHEPGSKIINAFYKGYNLINANYDIVCKFDADLIFPKNYLSELKKAFSTNPKLGMFAGFCYIQTDHKNWEIENLTNKEHIRGPLKAYRNLCFQQIGGLQSEMGWDTVDELLARYYGWETKTTENLIVKHLKPTGKLYSSTLAQRFGVALYKMDYGIVLSFIGLLKLGYLKKETSFFVNGITSYIKAALHTKPEKMVNAKQGKFIRNYRWKMIFKKIKLTSNNS